jgi:Dyp-type peroxidase family
MAAPGMLTADERADVQGFATSGYGHLPVAAYLFIRCHDAAAARRWLTALTRTITTSAPWPRDGAGRTIKPTVAVNVAFTAEGLRACGVPAPVLCTFPPEFQEGIASPARSRILGDTQKSDPASWEVGGPSTDPMHAVVIVHALDHEGLDAACVAERARIAAANGGVVELEGPVQRGYRPNADAEPFGFRDGITQPKILGIDGDGVPTGEFILGYPNHYDVMPPVPVVPDALDPTGLLPSLANPYHATKGLRDLGRHGTFVVYRKLQQDVAGFWRFMRDEAVRRRGEPDAAYMVWLASKMVGRWPSGAPMVLAADHDNPTLAAHDAFEFGDDPQGLACPIGAHIRRSHPRDDLKPYPREQSRHMADAHRLLRRARVFGRPLFDPVMFHDMSVPAHREALLALEDDGEARGIHFFCVNASIRSQFEFVQQTWCNNPRFGGLSDSKDPLVGDHGRDGEPPTRMTIPRAAGQLRTAPMPRFVTVRAGGYFFMPSLRALRFLGGFET